MKKLDFSLSCFLGVFIILFFSAIVVAELTRKNIVTTGGQVPATAIGPKDEVDIESGRQFFYDCIETPPTGHPGHYIFYGMGGVPYFREGDMDNHKVIMENVAGEVSVDSISSDGDGKMVCIKPDGALGTCSNRPIGPDVTCECL